MTMMRIGGRNMRPPSALKSSDQPGHTLQSEGAVTKRFAWQKSVLAGTSPHANGRREHGMYCKSRSSLRMVTQIHNTMAGRSMMSNVSIRNVPTFIQVHDATT